MRDSFFQNHGVGLDNCGIVLASIGFVAQIRDGSPARCPKEVAF